MKYLILTDNNQTFSLYQEISHTIQHEMDSFLSFLLENYQVSDLPRAVVLADFETATHSISSIPIPAYTNDVRTVFCPEKNVWRNIYLRQLAGQNDREIHTYYETRLSGNSILQILGHEFVHHSDLFLDGFEDGNTNGIWFEEGMCEYISRKFFLTDEEFREEAYINALLVKKYQDIHGKTALEDFGLATYKEDYAGIFCSYWRSFLAVQTLVDHHEGNVMAVFREYHRWFREGCKCPLSSWFGIE